MMQVDTHPSDVNLVEFESSVIASLLMAAFSLTALCVILIATTVSVFISIVPYRIGIEQMFVRVDRVFELQVMIT